MERTEILTTIQNVFRDIIDEDDLLITENSTSSDVEGWDSLTHIHLVVNIEKSFNVKFSASEISSWANIGQIVDSIILKSTL